jgi:hypothetical protein
MTPGKDSNKRPKYTHFQQRMKSNINCGVVYAPPSLWSIPRFFKLVKCINCIYFSIFNNAFSISDCMASNDGTIRVYYSILYVRKYKWPILGKYPGLNELRKTTKNLGHILCYYS